MHRAVAIVNDNDCLAAALMIMVSADCIGQHGRDMYVADFSYELQRLRRNREAVPADVRTVEKFADLDCGRVQELLTWTFDPGPDF